MDLAATAGVLLLTAACPPSLVAQACLGIGSSREELISSLIVMLSEPLHLKSAATPDHECVCVWGEASGKAKA